MANLLGVKGYDYVEFYVGSAKTAAYWHAKALGMKITGYLGPETGVRDRASYYLTQNQLKFVITSPLRPSSYDVGGFVNRHGGGVKRWAIRVENVGKAFDHAIKNKAVPARTPHKLEDDNGYVEEAAIRIYDDTELVFINYDNYNGVFKPGFEKVQDPIITTSEPPDIIKVDHIVGNVRENEMDHWAEYFNRCLGFETFLYFGPGDISTQYSSLISKVVRSKDNLIRNPINEPHEGLKMSQIEEYIREYHGSGTQHMALLTKDIISTIRALRNNGVDFLEVPKTYYEKLRKLNSQLPEDERVKQNLDQLEELGILCDFEGTGYLLQLFTKPIEDRPTFFFEIIQRVKGASGFGHGNFQSLFEAIEREQARRGNLDY